MVSALGKPQRKMKGVAFYYFLVGRPKKSPIAVLIT